MTKDTTQLIPGELAQLLGSRLCHDLVSPLGAIGNGVELLEMSPDFPGIANSPELRLIAESVAAARNRIQAFRIAFGQTQGSQRVSRAELAKLITGMAAQTRLTVQLDAEGDFSRAEVRMVMLAMMCLETALPWGGSITIVHSTNNWRFVAEASRTKQDPNLWHWLGGDCDKDASTRSVAPSEVQFALLAEAAQQEQRTILWDVDETGAELLIKHAGSKETLD